MHKVRYEVVSPRSSCPFNGCSSPAARDRTFRVELREGARFDQAHFTSGLVGQIEWLWPGHIPFGRVTLIEGPAMAGKSLLALDLVARLCDDRPWPDGTPQPTPGSKALLICRQDHCADVVGARLQALGCQPGRYSDFRDFETLEEEEEYDGERPVSLPFDLPALRHILDRDPSIRLVLIDSLSDVCSGKKAIAETLHELNSLASHSNVAIVITLRSQAKFNRQGQLSSKSRFDTDAARVQWCCVPDPDDPTRILFLPTLMNYTALPPGMAFRPGDLKLDWLEHDINPRDPLKGLSACALWLKELLSKEDELVKTIMSLGKQCGFPEGQVREAYKEIGAKYYRPGFAAQIYWSIGAGRVPPEEKEFAEIALRVQREPASRSTDPLDDRNSSNPLSPGLPLRAAPDDVDDDLPDDPSDLEDFPAGDEFGPYDDDESDESEKDDSRSPASILEGLKTPEDVDRLIQEHGLDALAAALAGEAPPQTKPNNPNQNLKNAKSMESMTSMEKQPN